MVVVVATCSRLIKKPFVWPLLDAFANDHTWTRKIRVQVSILKLILLRYEVNKL